MQLTIIGILHSGTNSRGILEAMLRGIEKAGHRVLRFDLPAVVAEFQQQSGKDDAAASLSDHLLNRFLETARSNNVNLSIGMWSIGVLGLPRLKNKQGNIRSLHEVLGLPHLLYWIDSPWLAQGKTIPGDEALRDLLNSPAHVHLTMSTSTAEELAGLWKWRNVLPIDYAVDEDMFPPAQGNSDEAEYDLVMANAVGNPSPTELMLRELESDRPDVDAIRRDLAVNLVEPCVRILEKLAAPADSRKDLVQALIDQRLADPHGSTLAFLAQAAKKGSAAEAADALTLDLISYRNLMRTMRKMDSWRRAFDVVYFSRHCSTLVIGDNSLDDWPYKEAVAPSVPYEDLAQQYRRGRVGLNVMRWQDDAGLNIKPLEMACCGLPVLQGKRAGVERVFELDKEVLMYDLPHEGLAKLQELLTDPERRNAIAQAGRTRVLREHTWTARFSQIVSALGL